MYCMVEGNALIDAVKEGLYSLYTLLKILRPGGSCMRERCGVGVVAGGGGAARPIIGRTIIRTLALHVRKTIERRNIS